MWIPKHSPNGLFGLLIDSPSATVYTQVMSGTFGYKLLLQRELESRCARKSGYSLRAFARDLNLSPSSLSLILTGRQGLSLTAAQRIGKKLELSDTEFEFFCDSVESSHSRSPMRKRLAQLRVKKHSSSAESTLQLDVFRVMSDWYHVAILELTEIEGFESSYRWIAEALGTQERVIKLAVGRLKRLGLLEGDVGKGKRLRQTQGFMATPSGVPSDAIKNFHCQILKKAEAALYTQSVDERDFSVVMVPIRLADVNWAKDQIKQFRRELMERLERAPKKDRVYCLQSSFSICKRKGNSHGDSRFTEMRFR